MCTSIYVYIYIYICIFLSLYIYISFVFHLCACWLRLEWCRGNLSLAKSYRVKDALRQKMTSSSRFWQRITSAKYFGHITPQHTLRQIVSATPLLNLEAECCALQTCTKCLTCPRICLHMYCVQCMQCIHQIQCNFVQNASKQSTNQCK